MYFPEFESFIINERPVSGYLLFGRIPLPLFNEVILPIEGVNQEVFHNRTYSYSIRYQNARGTGKNSQKVRKGDYIYYISLAPRPYHINGKITTKDGNTRTYDMSFELVITDSTYAIQKYHNKEYPVNWVITQFTGAFEYCISKMENGSYDKVQGWLNRKAIEFSKDCGIKVEHPNWFFHTLYDTLGKDEIQLNVEQRKRELLADNEIKQLEEQIRMERERAKDDFAREKREKHNEFARRENMRKHINEAQASLLSNTVDDLILINKDRIRDALDYNGSVQTILEESLKLLAIFNGSSKTEGKVVEVETTFSDRAHITKNEEGSIERNTEETLRSIPTSNNNSVANTGESPNLEIHFQKPSDKPANS